MKDIRKIIHPLLLFLVSQNYKNLRIKQYGFDLSQVKTPVIFVANHSNGFDFPVIAKVVKRHFYILAACQMKDDKVVNILNRLNGCVYVDRRSPFDKLKAKKDLQRLIATSHSILIFPEGTWNLSPSPLLLPLNWGCIDLSHESGIPIVPIGIIYENNTAFVNIGDPFLPTKTKEAEIITLTDKMAILLWEMMALSKTHIDAKWLKQHYVEEVIKSYKNINLSDEYRVVRKTHLEQTEIFAHLKTISPNYNNAFLFNKRLK